MGCGHCHCPMMMKNLREQRALGLSNVGVRGKRVSSPRDDTAGASLGVQLAYPCDEHSPCYSTAESHLVAVNGSLCRRRIRSDSALALRSSARHSRLAHSLTVLNASLNTDTSGTSRKMASVTRDPPRLLTQRSSRFLRRPSSLRERSSGTAGRARRAKRRSNSIPAITQVMMGTKASGTDCSAERLGQLAKEEASAIWLTVTSRTPSVCLSMPSNSSKNSSRSTCLGTTSRVSISAPGPCTPKR